MTEREIPDDLGFLFGGMTDASLPVSAPPVLSEPENLTSQGRPVYSSRREARAAGSWSMDAAAEAPAAPSALDALFAPSSADLGATQAIPAAEVAAELAMPVAPYLVPQSAPVAIVPSWHLADDAETAQPLARPRQKRSSRGRGADRSTHRHAPAGHVALGRTAARAGDAKPLRQRIFGVGVMVAVAGLFAVLAIPAYADNDATTLTATAAVQTQRVEVASSAASTVTTTAREAYTATSASDLKSLYAAAMREQNIAAYLQSGAKAKGDDYPWFAELSRNQGGGLSPLGYYYRECVDFVAWRLNRDAGTTSAPFKWTWSKLTPNGGDGHQWKAAWLDHGWPTGTTPVPGSVAWFGNNHVGYVNGILDNGQVLIEEYNYTPHAYSTRVINPGDAYYLYAPPK